MGLLQRLNLSMPRTSSSAAQPALATAPPEEPWYMGENAARLVRAESPVVSTWVKKAQHNPSGRSLTGGLPGKEIK